MAFYNGNPYTNFRGINLKNQESGVEKGGILRFGGTNSVSSTADELILFVDNAGTARVLTFYDGSGGTGEHIISPGFMSVRTIDSTITLSPLYAGLLVVNPTSSITITLPGATVTSGLTYTLVNRSAFNIRINSATGEDINTAGTRSLNGATTIDTQGDFITLVADGGGTWFFTSRYIQ